MDRVSEKLNLVFVYGTLKRNDCRNYLLLDSIFLNNVLTEARYRLFDLGSYPGLIESLDGSGNSIEGELYSVTDECLARLDKEEGVNEGLYERRSIRLEAPYHSFRTEAYFYLGDVKKFHDIGRRWNTAAQ